MKYSSTEGTTSVLVSADSTTTPSTTVSFNTKSIGEPDKLKVILTDGRYSRPSTDTPVFRLQLVDKNGKPTSFTDADYVYPVQAVASGGEILGKNVTILQGFSTSAVFDCGNPGIGPMSSWSVGARIPRAGYFRLTGSPSTSVPPLE